MKFNIDDYKGKYVMHCKTEEEAKDFTKYLIAIKAPHIPTCSLSCYYGKNVYFFNKGTWCSKEYAGEYGYTILEWSDFMNKEFTKADLKTGDVVKFRNGKIGIVNGDLETIIMTDSWCKINSFNEDLTVQRGCVERFDIVAVRRPEISYQCQFCAFEKEYGILVYERKEVEEMTLAEVCKLLGKEIKIVK